jgi:hypothetical protein
MDQVQNERATVTELISLARQRGLELEPHRNDSMIQVGERWISFWRKLEDLPCSGSADEDEGTLHYNLQGQISKLPRSMAGSPVRATALWSEAGTFENSDQAVDLLRAWLIDTKEVDELPKRNVRRYGI